MLKAMCNNKIYLNFSCECDPICFLNCSISIAKHILNFHKQIKVYFVIVHVVIPLFFKLQRRMAFSTRRLQDGSQSVHNATQSLQGRSKSARKPRVHVTGRVFRALRRGLGHRNFAKLLGTTAFKCEMPTIPCRHGLD